VNSLPKTVTRQRRDCDSNPRPSAPESSTLTTRLPSHPGSYRPRILPIIEEHYYEMCSSGRRVVCVQCVRVWYGWRSSGARWKVELSSRRAMWSASRNRASSGDDKAVHDPTSSEHNRSVVRQQIVTVMIMIGPDVR